MVASDQSLERFAPVPGSVDWGEWEQILVFGQKTQVAPFSAQWHATCVLGIPNIRPTSLRTSHMASLRPTTNSLVSAIAASACVLAAVAHGEIITSNLSDPNPDGGSFVNSAFPQRAQAFSTTVTGTQISSVTMDVASSTASQPFSVKLYSTGTAGTPSSSVATLFSGTGGNLTSPFVISGLSVNLAPSTQYFVVMEAAGTFAGQWNYNLETTGTGDGFLIDNSLAQTSIDNWQG
ncbi:MAG: choice-of-anchor R domain-containing protein, partial [Planctomycetota bacterium]